MKYISLKQVNDATLHVQQDLFKSGFWYEDTKLNKASVFWTGIPSASSLGLFYHGSSKLNRAFGFSDGNIFIPSITISKWIKPYQEVSLRDIIRHEYGHAMAHYYPELIVDNREFRKVFNGHYYDSKSALNDDSSNYVSLYAQSSPMEDFAETFMVYTRRHGRSLEKMNEGLLAKWAFIDWLSENV